MRGGWGVEGFVVGVEVVEGVGWGEGGERGPGGEVLLRRRMRNRGGGVGGGVGRELEL